MMKAALILMTRVPVPGKTKTRLMELLTGEQCAELHFCFLLDVFKTLESIKQEVDIFLTYAEESDFHILKDSVPSFISCFPQQGNSLGSRMSAAIGKLVSAGYEKVVLIGSDIPQLNRTHILEAFELLDQKDICLGPTYDGGYYLIGMKEHHEDMFTDRIKWGNKSVLERTVAIANSLNLTTALAEKYIDIDTKEDLYEFLKAYRTSELKDENTPTHTIEFLRKYIEVGKAYEEGDLYFPGKSIYK